MFTYLDLLSPPITLFHLERRTHTSKIGACLVIILVTVSGCYISYLLYSIIMHNKVVSMFYKKFEFEAEHYPFNSSSIFHFIQIFSSDNGGYFDKYDTKYIRAFTTLVHSNFNDSDLELYDHWVFDTCRKNIDDKYVDPFLFHNIENFTNAVCIKYFFNSTEKKYYQLEEKGFFWPYLEHGVSQRNNIYLTTTVQKCTNDSIINELFGNCPSQKEIDEYLSHYLAIYLYFTDIKIDPTNYKKPTQKYLQTITTSIGTSETFVENYIHYSPLKIRTNEGSLFGSTHELKSFYFDFNLKNSKRNNQKYFTITKYYHLMQNNVQIYERRYNNIFDLLSEIGGIIQSVFYIFYWLNYIYNKYVIAYDTNSLFFHVKDNQFKELDAKKKLNQNDNNVFKAKRPLKKFTSLQVVANKDVKKKNSSNKLSLKEDFRKDVNINQNRRKSGNFNNINIKSDNYLNSIFLSKNLNKKLFKNNNDDSLFDFNSSLLDLKNNNNLMVKKGDNSPQNNNKNLKAKNRNSKLMKTFNYSKNEKYYYNKIWMSKNSIAKIDHKIIDFNQINKEKMKSVKNLNFFIFLKSLCFHVKGSTNFLIKFRKHLLSEEHLFKSHIKTILIEKEFNSKTAENTNVFECFNEL